MTAPDLRRIRFGIEISGRINWYEGMRVKASGTKFANTQQNECTLTVSGLSMPTRDHLLTETSPFNSNRTPKRLMLEVGRVSTGMFRIFTGDIVSAEPSQPPDVDIVIKAKTQSYQAGNVISMAGGPISKLSAIAQRVADEMNLGLDFQATDKNVSNFSFSGAALKLVNQLQDAGGVRSYIDDDILIVKNYASALKGRIRVLSANTGMVGIPKATEKGLDVTFLIDSESLLGGMLRLDSKMNKSLNGDYVIDQLKFDVESHETPFFYSATCSRP